MFKDLVTGNEIDTRLDPQVKAILEEVAKLGGLPAEIQAKRKVVDALFIERPNKVQSSL